MIGARGWEFVISDLRFFWSAGRESISGFRVLEFEILNLRFPSGPSSVRYAILPRRPWRGVRVAEGARLESVFGGNSNVGSNPTLSATPLE